MSAEALAQVNTLRRGVAEDTRGSTAVKPWGSTVRRRFYSLRGRDFDRLR